MKILLLCNKVPYPSRDGSTIAIASMIDGLLANGASVSLMCFNTVKHYRAPEEIHKALPQKVKLKTAPIDNRVRPLPAFLNLLTSQAFHVSRFRDKGFKKLLIEELAEEQYDVVQIEGLSMAVYLAEIRKYSQAKIVLRAHNVETTIWQRHLRAEKNPLIRAYLSIQNNRLARFERHIAYQVDAIISITEEDLQKFWQLQPGKVAMSVPCGVDLNHYPACSGELKDYDLVYVASFDWMPNRQGIKWFLDEVWPAVLKLRPVTRFRLGGSHMPKDIADRASEQLIVEASVSDMRNFMCSGQLAVIPLLAGSGMRIKVLENMALGLCQVTTTIGAEGIKTTDGQNIVLVDDPAAMAERIVALLQDPELIKDIGRQARENARDNYSNKLLGKGLLEFYQTEVCK